MGFSIGLHSHFVLWVANAFYAMSDVTSLDLPHNKLRQPNYIYFSRPPAFCGTGARSHKFYSGSGGGYHSKVVETSWG
jgi:hypothetical protein